MILVASSRNLSYASSLSDRCAPRGRAFTLIDVLVSVSVIGILIGILLPSLAGATRTTRRVVCSSNVRQIGLGLYMYADDFKGYLVPSIFVPDPSTNRGSQPQSMVRLRFQDPQNGLAFANSWDGLGILYSREYLSSPKIFYCPAHRGNHPYSKYAGSFGVSPNDIFSNYHYRGMGPDGTKVLHKIVPSDSALVADAMRTRSDFNHRNGLNVLRADQGVVWFADTDRALAESLPDDDSEGVEATVFSQAWGKLDLLNSGH